MKDLMRTCQRFACRLLVAAASCGFVFAPAQAATTAVDPATLKAPTCEAPLQFNEADGVCGLAEGAKASDFTEQTCPKVSGFEVRNQVCEFEPSKARAPTCSNSVSNLRYNAQSKSCEMVVGQPTSSPGDYVGDCFRIKAEPSGSGMKAGQVYMVTGQEVGGEDGADRTLKLVDGKLNLWPFPVLFGCVAQQGGRTYQASSGLLMEHGASRYGWAFGALAMPYKYYPSAKRFTAGLPIGAYLGWRRGVAGSGNTIAVAVTLSQVRADLVTKDAQGNEVITRGADVAALSGAFGMVFDISKRPSSKAFKAGLFFGKDRVNTSDNVRYDLNHKWWMAVQLGYDFTDN